MTLLLFLASRSMLQPYLYYEAVDKLIRFKQPLVYGPPRKNHSGVLGSMVFYMLLRARSMIDPTLSVSLSMIQAAPCSGWKGVLKRSGFRYIKALAPEKNPEETKKRPRETEADDMSDEVKKMCKLHEKLRVKGYSKATVSILQYFKLCIPQCQ